MNSMLLIAGTTNARWLIVTIAAIVRMANASALEDTLANSVKKVRFQNRLKMIHFKVTKLNLKATFFSVIIDLKN